MRAQGVVLGDGGVPDGVQVCLGAVEGDGDGVTAEVESFVVQGLVDVADEVDEEFEGFEDLFGGKGGGLDARGLCEGGGLVGGRGVGVVFVWGGRLT